VPPLRQAPIRSVLVLAGALLCACANAPAPRALHAGTTTSSTTTAASLPEVEVCGLPPAVRRPASMTLACADDNSRGIDLRWSTWTPTGATATGLETWNTCRPDCAQSTSWDSTAADFTLGHPVPTAAGALFESLTVTDTGPIPSGAMRTVTYTEAPGSSGSA